MESKVGASKRLSCSHPHPNRPGSNKTKPKLFYEICRPELGCLLKKGACAPTIDYEPSKLAYGKLTGIGQKNAFHYRLHHRVLEETPFGSSIPKFAA